MKILEMFFTALQCFINIPNVLFNASTNISIVFFFCFTSPLLDKELARVRTKFVEKVSKELINQLLDDILEDGVLNDGEKDSILEENKSTADKARRLIDIVKKKGNVASRKMIAHLQSRDATLYAELGLSCGQPAQPGELTYFSQGELPPILIQADIIL